MHIKLYESWKSSASMLELFNHVKEVGEFLLSDKSQFIHWWRDVDFDSYLDSEIVWKQISSPLFIEGISRGIISIPGVTPHEAKTLIEADLLSSDDADFKLYCFSSEDIYSSDAPDLDKLDETFSLLLKHVENSKNEIFSQNQISIDFTILNGCPIVLLTLSDYRPLEFLCVPSDFKKYLK